MSLWNESDHRRFHGKFVEMGLTRALLEQKHKVRIGKDRAGLGKQQRPVLHKDAGVIGAIRHERGKGYRAMVGHTHRQGMEMVSSKPFPRAHEAAAAVAAAHPVVKSLHNRPEAGGPKKVQTDEGTYEIHPHPRGGHAVKLPAGNFVGHHPGVDNSVAPPTKFADEAAARSYIKDHVEHQKVARKSHKRNKPSSYKASA